MSAAISDGREKWYFRNIFSVTGFKGKKNRELSDIVKRNNITRHQSDDQRKSKKPDL